MLDKRLPAPRRDEFRDSYPQLVGEGAPPVGAARPLTLGSENTHRTMLEELHAWGPKKQQRWGITRSRGKARYVIGTGAVAAVIALLIAGIYVGLNRSEYNEIPWNLLGGCAGVGLLSGLFVAAIKWRLCEGSFLRAQGTRRN